jgi:hypothetical protein
MQITRGLLQKYGAERVRDTPITEVCGWLVVTVEGGVVFLPRALLEKGSDVLFASCTTGGFHRDCHRSCNGRLAAGVRVHDLQLRHASH